MKEIHLLGRQKISKKYLGLGERFCNIIWLIKMKYNTAWDAAVAVVTESCGNKRTRKKERKRGEKKST